MQITLPDGSVKQYPGPVTPAQVAREIGQKLADATLGARVTFAGERESRLLDARRPIDRDASLNLITAPRPDKQGLSQFRDEAHRKDALYLLRHSCAHVMAEAIEDVYGRDRVRLAYGPPLDTGYYYDLALDTPISAGDFERIEARMRQIVAEDRPFTRYELPPGPGVERLRREGNKYKLDNAQRAIAGGAATLSWYVTGPAPASDADRPAHWEDLCMGPHVPSTRWIAAFKLMSVASSHWHGDVTSDRFQRVYGTAFFSQADLEAHLRQLDEARQRDHRAVGARLGLFTIDEKVGQGLVLWKPGGAVIREELQRFITQHLRRQGYSQVFTPHIGRLELYRTSGHFPYYADSQFPPLIEKDTMQALADEGCACGELTNRLRAGEIDGYLLKPMNCPHHIRIYASEKRSYRDLPVRLAEFGTVYRWEKSGELGGMTRVRGFTQDDAHLFVREDQLDAEVAGCLELVRIVLGTLGMNEYRVRVGLRDPDNKKYVGTAEQWDKAEAACKKAAATLGVPFSEEAGEAAFYGPKIDFVVRDVIGREWQLGTVQVDYQLPQRFELEYTGDDNRPHRPVMIHRAPFGSMERFVGCLIEHFNGAFPLWLSPRQVRVLPISDKSLAYARAVLAALRDAGLRAELDEGSDRINGKVKSAQEDKVNYMLVVGPRDEEGRAVSVRAREADRGDLGAMPLEAFVARALREVATHGSEPVGR
jgi:threonyl-tRNA synthetase